MPRSPVVAVTATTEPIRGADRVRVNAAYTRALVEAGLLPLVVPPLSAAAAPEILARVNGLVLTGGEDVDPARFGAARHARTEDPHAGRDESEIALCLAARDRKLPTLAICRGVQVANVALGGTLVQDIPSERAGALDHSCSERRHERVHDVEVTPGSRLAAALGATRLAVNSLHHQSVDRVANELVLAATSPDGIVEGLESRDAAWWCVGVQWHPEELTHADEEWDRALFAAFAAAVRAAAPQG